MVYVNTKYKVFFWISLYIHTAIVSLGLVRKKANELQKSGLPALADPTGAMLL